MEIYMNGIKIDWVEVIPENFSAEVTEHTIMGGNQKDISSHIHVYNRIIPLHCILENTFGNNDKNRRYKQIHDMGNEKEIIKLNSFGLSLIGALDSKFDENYAIINIDEIEQGENFIEFNITLKAINFTKLKTVQTSIEPDKSLQVSAEKGKEKKVGAKTNKKTKESKTTKVKEPVKQPIITVGDY
ncbi:MAG: phage baseplate protein [Cetobacterium sp.]